MIFILNINPAPLTNPQFIMTNKLKKQVVHFVGIGGIGVSALARWYNSQGWRVTGSDIESSELTCALAKDGIPVTIGEHKAENVPIGAKLVIHTAAAKDNPEIHEAKRRKIKVRSYAEALGEATKKYLTIAVAGSHGKSTTTALIALILTRAGFDPTVIIGTKLREFADTAHWRKLWLSAERNLGSNFREGRSPVLVIEADEWNGSFWEYSPTITVITNIDKEHLDFYKTEQKVLGAFRKFMLRTRPGGHIVANADDNATKKIADHLEKKYPRRFKGKTHKYSIYDKEAARVRASLRLPGFHNASNAMAAYTVSRILNIPCETIEKTLSEFEGAWRRFERIGFLKGATIIADYAHHPTEIQRTLEATRLKFGSKKIIAVFQPHQYERTKHLFRDFQNAFYNANTVCLIDIYEVAGREHKRRNPRISAFGLAEALAKKGVNAYHISYPSQLNGFLKSEADANSVILMMGAGSIWKLGNEVLK